MAKTEFICSVEQGFNFQKDSQEKVGHITKLKIGDKEFKTDINVQNPMEIEKGDKSPVVGVLSYIGWNGGHAEPILFDCRLSVENKQDLALQQHTALSNTNVEFSFIVYEYDPLKKVYFKSFHTENTDLKGLVLKNPDDSLSFFIEMDQAPEVESPKNFVFSLGVMPQEEEQVVNLAVGVEKKFAKKWGVSVKSGASN